MVDGRPHTCLCMILASRGFVLPTPPTLCRRLDNRGGGVQPVLSGPRPLRQGSPPAGAPNPSCWGTRRYPLQCAEHVLTLSPRDPKCVHRSRPPLKVAALVQQHAECFTVSQERSRSAAGRVTSSTHRLGAIIRPPPGSTERARDRKVQGGRPGPVCALMSCLLVTRLRRRGTALARRDCPHQTRAGSWRLGSRACPSAAEVAAALQEQAALESASVRSLRASSAASTRCCHRPVPEKEKQEASAPGSAPAASETWSVAPSVRTDHCQGRATERVTLASECTADHARPAVANECTADNAQSAVANECTANTAWSALASECTASTAQSALANECTTNTAWSALASECTANTAWSALANECTANTAQSALASECTADKAQSAVASECTANTAQSALASECTADNAQSAVANECTAHNARSAVANECTANTANECTANTAWSALANECTANTAWSAVATECTADTANECTANTAWSALASECTADNAQSGVANECTANTAWSALANECTANTAWSALASECTSDNAQSAVANECTANTARSAVANECTANTAWSALASECTADNAQSALANECTANTANECTANTAWSALASECTADNAQSAVANDDSHTAWADSATNAVQCCLVSHSRSVRCYHRVVTLDYEALASLQGLTHCMHCRSTAGPGYAEGSACRTLAMRALLQATGRPWDVDVPWESTSLRKGTRKAL
ncbi:hypothetical protein NDU88_005444 [Pleurodeles waltl]|uniref:Uncharacterized protein n=1 Tax=Pleurodeles waltl TaxID=8319 RepID=A0AAV7L0T4_PLEWA|nr:hypothetical protein NDU88_005444 [Pleurodeles waltl]